MPIPAVGNDIDVGFGVDELGLFRHSIQQSEDKLHDESDLLYENVEEECFIETKMPIESIAYSKYGSQLGYLAIMCGTQVTVYYVYDEFRACYDLWWELDCRLLRELSNSGRFTCIEFEGKGLKFATASNLGCVAFWSISSKELTRALTVFHPVTKKPSIISAIHYLENAKDEVVVITYSNKTNDLLYSVERKAEIPEKKQRKYLQRLPEYYFETVALRYGLEQGMVNMMKSDPGYDNLIVGSKSGWITVYNLASLSRVFQTKIGRNTPLKVFVDDLCTYLAYPVYNLHEFKFHLFDWDYKCKRIVKEKRPSSFTELSPRSHSAAASKNA